MAYSVFFEQEARTMFLELDNSIRERIAKKLKQLELDEFSSRHLEHGVPVFVEEVGQYRIVFKKREELKQKRIVFVGDHKEYENWYKKRT